MQPAADDSDELVQPTSNIDSRFRNTASFVMSMERFRFLNRGRARSRAMRWGALTVRHCCWADSTSLNTIATSVRLSLTLSWLTATALLERWEPAARGMTAAPGGVPGGRSRQL